MQTQQIDFGNYRDSVLTVTDGQHKESTVNLMNNTNYMNTNTSSVATTILQEKIEQLEKEKINLLQTINSMSVYNDYVVKKNN